jgi:transposase
MRRNRNVTLEELRLALTRCNGNRSAAARWLGVSFAWVMILIKGYEENGETHPAPPPSSSRPARAGARPNAGRDRSGED